MRLTKKLLRIVLFCLCFPLTLLFAQESIVYVAPLSTGFYHTGMVIPLSALFYKAVDSDTTWSYKGRPNNRIFDVAFHYPSKGKYMALATHTGVHQSFDYGKTWRVTSGWRITEVNHVAYDPINPDVLYCSSPYGFYKTTDAGKSWAKHNKGLQSINAQFVSSFIIDHANPHILYCSTEDVAYKSTDMGESWQKMGLRIKHIRTIVQHPKDAKVLAVGTENNGLYFSNDGGETWGKRDTGIFSSTFYTIAFDPLNPDIVYAAGFQTGVYKSTDGGKKWKQYFKGLPVLDIHAIVIDPQNSNCIYAGTMGQGVYRSDDGGQTWNFAGIKNGFISAIKIESF